MKKILFIGSKKLGLATLEEIYRQRGDSSMKVMTFDDGNDTRGVYNDFVEFARKNTINLHTAKNRKDSEQIILETRPDFCLVVGWYWLFSEKVINSVKGHFIGVHNSLLPKYRGGAPLVWSIINGEKETGATVFSFNNEMDAGPVWGYIKILVSQDDYISDILAKLEEGTVRYFRDNWKKIINGEIKPEEQNHDEATYCAQRIAKDGIINWQRSSTEIYNFIRAQSHPYPGAYTLLGKKELIIWSAEAVDMPYIGTPGQVARITKNGVYVICGDMKPLIIKDVEFDGLKTSAKDIIKTIKIRF